ncbi:hypothetical protein BG006_002321, partial [Podila minutissima]
MGRALDERLPQEAVNMLCEKFVGRFRLAIVAMEKIVESNEQAAWKINIEDKEDKLVSWARRDIIGNLYYELRRTHNKYGTYSEQLVNSIDNIPSLHFYERCIFGIGNVVLNQADPQLMEHAFGRIKMIQGRAVTVLDEPFISKAVENCFVAMDPYFKKETQW